MTQATTDGNDTSWPLLRQVVMRGQFSAVVMLPLCLIAGAVLAGGGLLMAGFALIALPLMLVLAVPPLVGRYAGKIRAASDLSAGYCLATIALWVVVVPIGFLLTSAQPAPLDLQEADPIAYRMLADVCLVLAPVLWVAQAILGLLAGRFSRRAR